VRALRPGLTRVRLAATGAAGSFLALVAGPAARDAAPRLLELTGAPRPGLRHTDLHLAVDLDRPALRQLRTVADVLYGTPPRPLLRTAAATAHRQPGCLVLALRAGPDRLLTRTVDRPLRWRTSGPPLPADLLGSVLHCWLGAGLRAEELYSVVLPADRPGGASCAVARHPASSSTRARSRGTSGAPHS
jgi:hypothetical protein